MTKILENTFRLVNISFINETAIIAKKMDADIWEVIDAAKTKPFGFMPFYTGPGLGGHCIPVDPYYLSYKAKQLGMRTEFIDTASAIDDYMHEYVVNLTKEALATDGKRLKEAKLLIIGVAYKKDINDLRESPALKVIDLLVKENVQFDYYDSYIPIFKDGKHDICSLEKINKTIVKSYDTVLILTDHTKVDYDMILASAKKIVDTRNAIKVKSEKVISI